jgi:hypothetical protein
MRRHSKLLLALSACDATGAPATADAGPQPDAGPNDFRVDKIGFVNLIENGAGYYSLFALIQDRPELPTPITLAQDGECTVYGRPAPAFCEPACVDSLCTAPDVCTPWGANASAGTITVTGLKQALVFQHGMYGYEPQPPPAGDLFDGGDVITVSAPGEVTPGFSVNVTGVATLTAPFQNVELVDGVDHEFTWTAASGGARILLALIVGWHGGPYEAMLLCETDDDGALSVPGALIAQLPRQTTGLEQHPSWLMRFSRATVSTPAGPIEIVAGSQVGLYFSHP